MFAGGAAPQKYMQTLAYCISKVYAFEKAKGVAMRSGWLTPRAGYATPSCGKFAAGLCGNGVASGLRRAWRVFGRSPRRCMMRPA